MVRYGQILVSPYICQYRQIIAANIFPVQSGQLISTQTRQHQDRSQVPFGQFISTHARQRQDRQQVPTGQKFSQERDSNQCTSSKQVSNQVLSITGDLKQCTTHLPKDHPSHILVPELWSGHGNSNITQTLYSLNIKVIYIWTIYFTYIGLSLRIKTLFILIILLSSNITLNTKMLNAEMSKICKNVFMNSCYFKVGIPALGSPSDNVICYGFTRDNKPRTGQIYEFSSPANYQTLTTLIIIRCCSYHVISSLSLVAVPLVVRLE